MNKTELVAAAAEQTGMTKKERKLLKVSSRVVR